MFVCVCLSVCLSVCLHACNRNDLYTHDTFVQQYRFSNWHDCSIRIFCYTVGAEVTLVVSKTSERYRLQSDCFEALAVFEAELIKRLRQYYDDTVSDL